MSPFVRAAILWFVPLLTGAVLTAFPLTTAMLIGAPVCTAYVMLARRWLIPTTWEEAINEVRKKRQPPR